MLDTAVVGAGLTGLVVARALETAGIDYALFEARERFGGRILSRRCRDSGIEIDLGPAWYWPEQSAISNLVRELRLDSFPQRDDGTVWVLTDPDRRAEKLSNETLHRGALRVEGGMGRLVEGIASRLTPTRIALRHILMSVREQGPFMELRFDAPAGETEVRARRVVLAMPPRLIEEHILFSPDLPGELQNALRAPGTWMASQAKAVVVYDGAANFREEVGSGNAFVHHEHAVLREVFDASARDGRVPALGGFFALTPVQRSAFRDGMDMLVTSQFVQLFGRAYEKGRTEYQDWAAERFTCASQDRRNELLAPASLSGEPVLREALWGGKMRFAGSEFASREAGYLEGAVIDGERVASEVISAILAGRCGSKGPGVLSKVKVK